MPRVKRSPLPPVTARDRAEQPDRIRPTPSGWAWRCMYCSKYASSETLAGAYVCRDHGGHTPAQRSPEKRQQARQEGRKVPRPPGRPLKTGFYSKRSGVRIDELIEDYQARKLNADHTDEDMLYLRAYLEEMKGLRPSVEALSLPLQELAEATNSFANELVAEEGDVTVERVLDHLNRAKDWQALTHTTLKVLKRVESVSKDIEARHARLITLSKVRSETRLKNEAVHQVTVFSLLVRNFMVVLEEQLSPADFAALQRRIEKDLAELPQDVLTGAASVEA